MKSAILIFSMLVMLFPAGMASALDNPDASNYVEEFQSRAKPYEDALDKAAGSNVTSTYVDYEHFLDNELNKAYVKLIKRLDNAEKKALIKSQKDWLVYRDSEFQFIGNEWTRERFGSSYALSNGGYRSEIIKDRTITLLSYLANFH